LIERKEAVAALPYSLMLRIRRRGYDMPHRQREAAHEHLAARVEEFVRREYERCRPGDTFDALKRRAVFEKDSKGLLRDWLEVGRRRVAAGCDAEMPACSVAARARSVGGRFAN
jgi:hypothetical protein